MKKRYGLCLLLAIMTVITFSCTTSTSVDGASIDLGREVDDDLLIVSPETTFQAGEEFYYSFNNNDPFDSNKITLQLLGSESDEVLLEYDYEVDPEWNILSDTIWFNEPGTYKVVILIDGKIRATQEVVIE